MLPSGFPLVMIRGISKSLRFSRIDNIGSQLLAVASNAGTQAQVQSRGA